MSNGSIAGTLNFETEFQLTVASELLHAVPNDIRADRSLLQQYLNTGLEIGLKSMAMAGVQLDREVVKEEFADFANRVGDLGKGLEKIIGQELTEDDSRLARQLTQYLGDDGKLGRAVRNLEEQLVDPERETSIPGAVKALLSETFFDADSPFRKALDIADDNSPLKRFVVNQRQQFKEFQEDQVKNQTKLTESIEANFQRVFDHIGYKSELEESESKGSRKGGDFEDQCTDVISSVAFNKDEANRVGRETIDGTRVKRGDILVDVNQEGFDDKRIIVEAKSGSYSLTGKTGVLNQLTAAMQFRNAEGGIVVVTADHAGKRQRTFDRLGSNRIVVVVDPTDEENGFLPLEVAYAVLREELLSQQTVESSEGPDITAAEGTIAEIQSSLSLVNSMKSNCTEAKKNVTNVREAIVKLEEQIRDKLKSLRSQLRIA